MHSCMRDTSKDDALDIGLTGGRRDVGDDQIKIDLGWPTSRKREEPNKLANELVPRRHTLLIFSAAAQARGVAPAPE